jgi:hypothetical protein
MRARSAALVFLCSVPCVATASTAGATDCSVPNSTCINSDVLWPHAGPARFLGVGSADTVAAGQLGFGLLTTYLSRPIPFLVPAPGGRGGTQYVINDQVNGDFLFSYGVTNRLELDFVLPLTFGQGGAGLEPVVGGTPLHDTAQRDLRFGAAYAIVPHLRLAPDPPSASGHGPEDAFGLVARFEMSAPSGDRSQFAGERTAVYIPSLAADLRAGPAFFGAEFGARIRPVTELEGARVGTQLVAGVGAGVDLLPHELLAATLEAWAMPTLASQGTGPALVPSEWQLAARSSPLSSGDLSIQLGGGTQIPFGAADEITRPRFRVSLSIRWAPSGHPREPLVPAANPGSTTP